jgi:phosphonate transport system permease protein
MFEYNVRSSAILGFVGAGGVGFYILGYLQRFQYQNLLTVLIFTLVVVLALDLLSGKLRARFLLQRLH